MAVSRQLEAYLEYNKLVEEDIPLSSDVETRKVGGRASGQGASSTGNEGSNRISQDGSSELPVRASRSHQLHQVSRTQGQSRDPLVEGPHGAPSSFHGLPH